MISKVIIDFYSGQGLLLEAKKTLNKLLWGQIMNINKWSRKYIKGKSEYLSKANAVEFQVINLIILILFPMYDVIRSEFCFFLSLQEKSSIGF